MAVTVPGPTGVVTVSASQGDVLGLAQKISAMLGAAWNADNLAIDTISGAAPSTGKITELLLTDPVVTGAIPSGWDAVIVNGSSGTPAFVVADNSRLLVDDNGGTFIVSSTSTVAATSGGNLVAATGTYEISSGAGGQYRLR